METITANNFISQLREQKTVSFSDFDQALDKVKSGESEFLIQTNLKRIPITKKDIEKFKKAGFDLISKSSDNKSFRLQQGRSKVAVLPGSLFEVEPGTSKALRRR